MASKQFLTRMGLFDKASLNVRQVPNLLFMQVQHKSKKSKRDDGCRKAVADLPKPVDPVCSEPCTERRAAKKMGILNWIKLKVVEGGTNFGTPFRMLDCKQDNIPCPDPDEVKKEKPKALVAPKKKGGKKKEDPGVPELRNGMIVTILGADSPVGHYTALLLKQCPCIKKIRLFEAKPCPFENERDICKVVQDLQHIDTNCLVEAYGGNPGELELCLQNSDIVLMLETCPANIDMPLETRFYSHAPLVAKYGDVISKECPTAFIIVAVSPIDCMVPLVAEMLRETGWYDPRKVLGSMAIPEMRASTLAARALSLEPSYTRVPCVGGTEGETLVPLFSRAVEYFDFPRHNAELMTETVRYAPKAVSYLKAAELSEAHAYAGLVKNVAYALLCIDIPRVSGYVETDIAQVITPARYIAGPVYIGGSGISKYLGIPPLNDFEMTEMHAAITEINRRVAFAEDWFKRLNTGYSAKVEKTFFEPDTPERIQDCMSRY